MLPSDWFRRQVALISQIAVVVRTFWKKTRTDLRTSIILTASSAKARLRDSVDQLKIKIDKLLKLSKLTRGALYFILLAASASAAVIAALFFILQVSPPGPPQPPGVPNGVMFEDYYGYLWNPQAIDIPPDKNSDESNALRFLLAHSTPTLYTVVSGDTVDGIIRTRLFVYQRGFPNAYAIYLEEIRRRNPDLKDLCDLVAGQKLDLPDGPKFAAVDHPEELPETYEAEIKQLLGGNRHLSTTQYRDLIWHKLGIFTRYKVKAQGSSHCKPQASTRPAATTKVPDSQQAKKSTLIVEPPPREVSRRATLIVEPPPPEVSMRATLIVEPPPPEVSMRATLIVEPPPPEVSMRATLIVGPPPEVSTKSTVVEAPNDVSAKGTVAGAPPEVSTKDTVVESSPKVSTKGTVAGAPPEVSTKDTVVESSPKVSTKGTVAGAPPEVSTKDTVVESSPKVSTKGTVAGAPPEVSTKDPVVESSPKVSTKGTVAGAPPEVSTKDPVVESSPKVSTKGTVAGAPPEVSTKGTIAGPPPEVSTKSTLVGPPPEVSTKSTVVEPPPKVSPKGTLVGSPPEVSTKAPVVLEQHPQVSTKDTVVLEQLPQVSPSSSIEAGIRELKFRQIVPAADPQHEQEFSYLNRQALLIRVSADDRMPTQVAREVFRAFEAASDKNLPDCKDCLKCRKFLEQPNISSLGKVKVLIADSGISELKANLYHPVKNAKYDDIAPNRHGTFVYSEVVFSDTVSTEYGPLPFKNVFVAKVARLPEKGEDAPNGYQYDLLHLASLMEVYSNEHTYAKDAAGGADSFNPKPFPTWIVNISASGQSPTTTCCALQDKKDGILFVAAAGNDHSDDLDKLGKVLFTSQHNVVNDVLIVGALDSDGKTIAPYSNHHSDIVDLYAPGSCVCGLGAHSSHSSGQINGTSQATPIVTVAAAVLAAKHPKWLAPAIKWRLISTSKWLDEFADLGLGGVVNLHEAMKEKFVVYLKGQDTPLEVDQIKFGGVADKWRSLLGPQIQNNVGHNVLRIHQQGCENKGPTENKKELVCFMRYVMNRPPEKRERLLSIVEDSGHPEYSELTFELAGREGTDRIRTVKATEVEDVILTIDQTFDGMTLAPKPD